MKDIKLLIFLGCGVSVVVIVIVLIGFSLAIKSALNKSATNTETDAQLAAPSTSVPQAGAYVDDEKEARQKYIDKINGEFEYAGLDAQAFDSDGTLLIKTDMLKSQLDRDKFIAQTFDRKYQQGLCAVGFKSMQVTSSLILLDGSRYALTCKAPKRSTKKQ